MFAGIQNPDATTKILVVVQLQKIVVAQLPKRDRACRTCRSRCVSMTILSSGHPCSGACPQASAPPSRRCSPGCSTGNRSAGPSSCRPADSSARLCRASTSFKIIVEVWKHSPELEASRALIRDFFLSRIPGTLRRSSTSPPRASRGSVRVASGPKPPTSTPSPPSRGNRLSRRVRQ